jgi:hypothetical protein
MSDLQTRLEVTLSLAAQCELEASVATDDVKRKNYRVMADFYEGVAEDLRDSIAESENDAEQAPN